MKIDAADRADARRYLKDASAEEIDVFAQRQLRARHRLAALLSFYRRNPCRMARIHLLTASAVAVGRFFARTLLQRPEELAAIHYKVEPLETRPLPSQLLAAPGAGRPNKSRLI